MVAWVWDSQVQFQGIRWHLLATEGTAHMCFVNTWRPKIYRKKVCELAGLTGIRNGESWGRGRRLLLTKMQEQADTKASGVLCTSVILELSWSSKKNSEELVGRHVLVAAFHQV